MLTDEMTTKLATHFNTDPFRVRVMQALIWAKTRRQVESLAKGFDSVAFTKGEEIHTEYRCEMARILRQLLAEFPNVTRFYGIRI